MKAIKRISKYILLLALLLLLFACAETDIVDVLGNSLQQEGRASVTLYVTTPESFSTSTRAISEENESLLEDKFAVFAFTEVNGEVDTLLFAVKSGDVNTKSNLDSENTYASSYKDYTSSPSIAWHEDESGVGGRLYIEYDEASEPIHLLVLANVDQDKVATLLEGENGSDPTITTGMSFEAVTEALEPALDFDVTDDSLTSIPMAGECELAHGFTLGSTGSISLRRSVAKFTVRVEYEKEFFDDEFDGDFDSIPFTPKDIQILNVNSFATVYSPTPVGTPNISPSDENEKVSPKYDFKDTWDYDETSDTYYKEIVFYVAETANSRKPAYTYDIGADGDTIYTENTEDPRISVLVSGKYVHETDGEIMDSCYYRLDLLPQGASSYDEELEYILRNHHYSFVISNLYSRPGSTSSEYALKMVADNEPLLEDTDFSIIIEDEDIISITVSVNSYVEDEDSPNYGQHYYVGVSNTNMELDYSLGTSACAHVKVQTNYSGWTLNAYNIPIDEDTGKRAISYVWDSDAKVLWIWLDYPEYVNVGDVYTFYILAGNIRKKMNITIVDSKDEQGSDEPD